MRAIPARTWSAVAVLAVASAGASRSTAQAPLHDAPASRHQANAASDSADAVAAVSGFHAALAGGDTLAVLAVLAPDVLIMEGGDIETLSEYRSHHLAGDIAYARAIAGVNTVRHVVVQRDVAWVSSTSIVDGRLKERRVNTAGAELVVLSRQNASAPWRIRAVHWSSHRRAP